MDEVLYKRGFSQPYLRWLALDEANYVLREVHEKEHVATTQELDHLSTRSSMQDTTGQLSKLMPRHMSRSAINVNNSVMSIDNLLSILP